MTVSKIKLAWIQFRHLHLGVVLVPWSSLFSEFLCLVSHSLTVSRFWKPCLSSWSRHKPKLFSLIERGKLGIRSLLLLLLLSRFSHVRFFGTPWIAARQASLSITNSWSSLKLTSIESVMPSSHLILCHPLFLIPSKEIPGLISFRMDWLDLFAVQGTS